jgi:biotin operon repressor
MNDDKSRNRKLGMQTSITEAQTAERLLRAGCTVTELAESLQCSTKKAREIIKVLRRLGCEIPEAPAGIREEWAYRMTGKSRLFARYK